MGERAPGWGRVHCGNRRVRRVGGGSWALGAGACTVGGAHATWGHVRLGGVGRMRGRGACAW